MSLVAVLLGGAAGAVARYLTDLAIARRFGREFPWGTLCVNVLGSLLLGLVLARTDGQLALLLGAGFCGALTTYSAFAAETVGLLDHAARGRAVANVLLNLALGIIAIIVGASWTMPGF